MSPRCHPSSGLLLPFLYPSLLRHTTRLARAGITTLHSSSDTKTAASIEGSTSTETSASSESLPHSRLNPPPDDYSVSTFADKARIWAHAGSGGAGCIAFLREIFIDNGPANGGDGGHGGNVYIQAVHSETSLHKLSRRRIIRAGRGKTGQGSSRAGQRGDDVVIQVPVGTVVREIQRTDPMAEEHMRWKQAREKDREFQRLFREAELKAEQSGEDVEAATAGMEAPDHPNLDKFILYPGISNSERRSLTLPPLPRRERLYHQPAGPIHLDLSMPTPRPILLAAGGVGGLGNPHFVSKERPRPLFATKGERAVSMQLELELKLLADVGLVGLPNAGKSTLLRALTRSRARVGNWAFTTLQPNIGTVVLDNHKGRRLYTPPKTARPQPHAIINDAKYGNVVIAQPEQIGAGPEPRTRFTVADIPGLIEGAHLDRGLGMEFLRHVERAGVLAFVVDLAKGDSVEALKSLWTEVGMYALMREEENKEREVGGRIDWQGDGGMDFGNAATGHMMIAEFSEAPDDESGLHIAAKPWYVVATKGDLPDTQDNFAKLKGYLERVTNGEEPHPSGVEGAWTEDCAAIPVSAINGHGVDRIVHWTVGLLDE
ncbi:obg family GTPase CgtA [Pseudomassariella vexata]|uniref:Obg family GTPase CgtA n=1 Tax=Pseudomassariella vexata TaxID=1141098 RepID=A0A1Y2DUU7_9PEZI|nr:obg family GTPase CgtA [Pseudomassariella vexata]ORY62959.1 obg family GTPase CgtA [Pseudomassariella vexata]